MIIGGIEKFSLIDYAGHLSAVVFTQGCNFRCHFCYNPLLVLPTQAGELKYQSSDAGNQKNHPEIIPEDDFFAFLKERVGKLDAVVVSGGEPTLHSDLDKFIKKIRDLGYKIKLDTNGTSPKAIEDLLKQKLLDYIAMDIKSEEFAYDLVVGVQPEMNDIKKSISIIKNSGVGYEFRTTIVPEFHRKETVEKMGKLIDGAEKWYLQPFKSDTDLVNKDFENSRIYTDAEMEELLKIASDFAEVVEIR